MNKDKTATSRAIELALTSKHPEDVKVINGLALSALSRDNRKRSIQNKIKSSRRESK